MCLRQAALRWARVAWWAAVTVEVRGPLHPEVARIRGLGRRWPESSL